MSGYAQLVRREFSIFRLPRGQDPVWDCELADHESIVGIYRSWERDDLDRTTVDHFVIAWVAVRL